MISRKGISFLLVFLLLASNSGLAFNVHFCGGELASVKAVFESGNDHSNSGCGMDETKSHGCCKDKVIKSDKKQDSIVKTVAFFTAVPFVQAEIQTAYFTHVAAFDHELNASYYCNANAPPLFKLYSQYIFYA